MHPVLPSRPQTGARSSRSSSSPSLSLGHMTAAMRAVALRPDATKRALRVGLLRDGRVLEERLVTHGTLTVGDAEDASFVIAGVRGKHRLFAEKDGRFTLAPLPGMRGRIATDDGVHDGALHGAMVLDPRTRGRLTLGDATLLFQMVDAPTKAPRPMLPSSVKTSLMDIVDWPLTILVAMSFLVHFGVVGAMYSDWTDRIVTSRSSFRASSI